MGKLEVTLEMIIKKFFEAHPNTSPLDAMYTIAQIFDVDSGMVMGRICIMREESLVVTGHDENGVLLSLSEEE